MPLRGFESKHLIKFSIVAIIIFIVALLPASTKLGYAAGVEKTVPVLNAYGVAIDSANNEIYVTSNTGGVPVSYSGNVTVIDGSTNVVKTTISVGTQPFGVAYDPTNGYIYVANCISDNITVIDGSTNLVVTTISTTSGSGTLEGGGGCPYGVAFDSANNEIYVTDIRSGTVSVINGSTGPDENNLITTVDVGPDPAGVAVDPADDTIWVALSSPSGGWVIVISGSNNEIITPSGITCPEYACTQPYGVAFDSANSEIYVTWIRSLQVTALSTSTFSVVATVPVEFSGVGGGWLTFDSSNGNLYASIGGGVTEISGSSNTVLGSVDTCVIPPGTGCYTQQDVFDSFNDYIYLASGAYGGSSGDVLLISPTITTTTTTTTSTTSTTTTTSTSTMASCGCSKIGAFVNETVSNQDTLFELATSGGASVSPDGQSDVTATASSAQGADNTLTLSYQGKEVLGAYLSPVDQAAWGWSTNSQFFVIAYQFSADSGTNSINLQVWDLTTLSGPQEASGSLLTYTSSSIPYCTGFSPPMAASAQSADYGAVNWGFSPDGNSFALAYSTLNPVSGVCSEFDLTVYSSVTGDSPTGLVFDNQQGVSSFWQWSPCGDIFMYVHQLTGLPTITGTVNFFTAPNGALIAGPLSLTGSAPSASVSSASGGAITISLKGMSETTLKEYCSTGSWSLDSGATILVTDSAGRSVGFNSTSQSIVNEIPGATYNGPDNEPQVVTISDPSGSYNVTLTPANGGGSYTLDFVLSDSQGTIQSSTQTGVISTASINYEYEAGTLNIIVTPEFPVGVISATLIPLLALGVYLFMISSRGRSRSRAKMR